MIIATLHWGIFASLDRNGRIIDDFSYRITWIFSGCEIYDVFHVSHLSFGVHWRTAKYANIF